MEGLTTDFLQPSVQAQFTHVQKSILSKTRRSRVCPPLRFPRPKFSRGVARAQISSLSLGREKPLTELESFIVGFPSAVRSVASLAVIVAAAAAGSAVGGKLNEGRSVIGGQLGGAVLLGAAGVGASVVVQKAGKEGAAKKVFNAVISAVETDGIDSRRVAQESEKYGIDVTDERLIEELRDIYDRYVTSILPPGNDPLTGEEVDSVIQFRNALGLDEVEAASVHVEIGRRIFRQRMEAGTKESSVAERKSFQKLVYVSNLVFGEKSKFLLPWKRVFKVTEAQVEVAILDNAKRLLEVVVEDSNAEPDLEKLRHLRQSQLKFRVSDEVAEQMFLNKSRERVEGYIEAALEVAKARTRIKDIPRVLSLLAEATAYSESLGKLSTQPDIIPGVTAITVAGGNFDGGRELGDLKMLYSIFLEDALSKGSLEQSKAEGLSKLRNLFGLGKKEAEAIEVEVISKVYRRQLAQSVKSGALDAAESKADFLEELCDKLRFDPEQAFKIHEDIYRQKLESCLKDSKLSDDDVKALQRLRVLLCIPQATVDTAHAEICGTLFAKVIDDAVSGGVDSYDPEMQKVVQGAVKGLRLPLQAAIDIASKKIKAVFMAYLKRARGTMNRTEAGRELKKMVIFSNVTVSQLLEDLRSGSAVTGSATAPAESVAKAEEKAEEAVPENVKEMERIYEEEYGGVQSMRKVKDKSESREGRAQKEINLRDELDTRDKQDAYEKYLLYAIQGEQVNVSFGAMVTVARDEGEFVRLAQLGDILGMTPIEVATVHQGLAEKAFKTQAETLLADGQLNKKRAEQLREIQKTLGLPDAPAQKIIQAITSSKMAGAIDRAVQTGKLTVEDIRGLKDAGVDIQSMVAKPARLQMYKKMLNQALTAGTGEFDSELVLQALPGDLGLEADTVKGLVLEAANEKAKDSLVQAVSLLRQKEAAKVVRELNNILTSDKAAPQSGSLTWPVKEELLDLYGLYISQPGYVEEKGARLRQLLDIDDRTAANLVAIVESDGFSLDSKEEDFVF